jgi:hypothetical protein
MEEIDETPGVEFVVGTVDGVECSFDVVVVGVGEMGDVDVGVLKPWVFCRVLLSIMEMKIVLWK